MGHLGNSILLERLIRLRQMLLISQTAADYRRIVSARLSLRINLARKITCFAGDFSFSLSLASRTAYTVQLHKECG